jgi:excisionase family DNA binding protein
MSRLGFGASRPFNLEEELADEQSRQNADDGWGEMDQMLPCGVTAEEALVMRMDHDRRVATAAQPQPRSKRKAAPPKTTAENGMLTAAGAAALLHISADAVLNLIHAGHLKAVNVGRGRVKPRWRIGRDALESFKRGRETASSGKRSRTRRSKSSEVEYF